MGGMVLVTPELLREAEEYTSLAERLHPTLPEVEFARANIALQRGNLETAARLFRDVLQVRPGNADALLNLAVTFVFLGKNEPAMPLIDEAQRLDPLTSVIHSVRSFAIWTTGNFAAAVDHNARFRALEPESPFARLLMMLMCAFIGRMDQAHQEAAELTTMAPDSMPARLGMFWSYGLRGERERAQALITAEVVRAAECDVQVTAFLAWGMACWVKSRRHSDGPPRPSSWAGLPPGSGRHCPS